MYTFPHAIQFGAGGNYKAWGVDGWHHDENDTSHTWMGDFAELNIGLSRPRSFVRLTIDILPKGRDQDLNLYVNGAFVKFWNIVGPSTNVALIRPNCLRPGENIISFVCPRAERPSDVSKGTDQRVLGLAFRKLTLAEAE